MISITDKLYWLAGKDRVPLTGAFEVSPLCNFSCKMCYVTKSSSECKKLGGIKPYTWWLELIRQCKDRGLLFPLFTGGEPFAYPHFKELYVETVRMGMQVSINTNASLITEEIVEWLRKEPPIRLNITLYGASNKTYGKLCGDYHGFDKVKKAVELLYKNNIRFKFNASITPLNQHEIKEIIDFGKRYGRNVTVANYMFPPIRRKEDTFGKNERVSPKECGYNQVLVDYYLLSEYEFKRKANAFSKFIPLTDELLKTMKENKNGSSMKCKAGRSSFWVDWQGNLSMCGMINLPKFSLANDSFNNCWKKVVNYVNDVRYSPICVNCPNVKLCHTCISMAYNETGTIEGRPEYLCEFNYYASKYYKEFLNHYIDDEKEKINSDDLGDSDILNCLDDF